MCMNLFSQAWGKSKVTCKGITFLYKVYIIVCILLSNEFKKQFYGESLCLRGMILNMVVF